MKLLLFKLNEEIISRKIDKPISEIVKILKPEFPLGNLFIYDFETNKLHKLLRLRFIEKSGINGLELSALYLKRNYKIFLDTFLKETNFDFDYDNYLLRVKKERSISLHKRLFSRYLSVLLPEEINYVMNLVNFDDFQFLSFILNMYFNTRQKNKVLKYDPLLINQIFVLLKENKTRIEKEKEKSKYIYDWHGEFFLNDKYTPFKNLFTEENEFYDFDYFMEFCINKFNLK